MLRTREFESHRCRHVKRTLGRDEDVQAPPEAIYGGYLVVPAGVAEAPDIADSRQERVVA